MGIKEILAIAVVVAVPLWILIDSLRIEYGEVNAPMVIGDLLVKAGAIAMYILTGLVSLDCVFWLFKGEWLFLGYVFPMPEWVATSKSGAALILRNTLFPIPVWILALVAGLSMWVTGKVVRTSGIEQLEDRS